MSHDLGAHCETCRRTHRPGWVRARTCWGWLGLAILAERGLPYACVGREFYYSSHS